jgi:hypothetical protein
MEEFIGEAFALMGGSTMYRSRIGDHVVQSQYRYIVYSIDRQAVLSEHRHLIRALYSYQQQRHQAKRLGLQDRIVVGVWRDEAGWVNRFTGRPIAVG